MNGINLKMDGRRWEEKMSNTDKEEKALNSSFSSNYEASLRSKHFVKNKGIVEN